MIEFSHLIEGQPQATNSPHSLGHDSRRFSPNEYVTSEPLHRRMFCDETDVAMISRMKCTKWNILQRVEIVDARTATFTLFLQG